MRAVQPIGSSIQHARLEAQRHERQRKLGRHRQCAEHLNALEQAKFRDTAGVFLAAGTITLGRLAITGRARIRAALARSMLHLRAVGHVHAGHRLSGIDNHGPIRLRMACTASTRRCRRRPERRHHHRKGYQQSNDGTRKVQTSESSERHDDDTTPTVKTQLREVERRGVSGSSRDLAIRGPRIATVTPPSTSHLGTFKNRQCRCVWCMSGTWACLCRSRS